MAEKPNNILDKPSRVPEVLQKQLFDMKHDINSQNISANDNTVCIESSNQHNENSVGSVGALSDKSNKTSLKELTNFRVIRKYSLSSNCTDDNSTIQPSEPKLRKIEEQESTVRQDRLNIIQNQERDAEKHERNDVEESESFDQIIYKQKCLAKELLYNLQKKEMDTNVVECSGSFDQIIHTKKKVAQELLDNLRKEEIGTKFLEEESENLKTVNNSKTNTHINLDESVKMIKVTDLKINNSTKDISEGTAIMQDEFSNISNDSNIPSEKLNAQEEEYDIILRASKETFLQHLPCFKLTGRIPKCRECRKRNVERQTANNADVYCRFYEFRRLQYNESGELVVSGFPNPYTEPTKEDLNIWQPDEETEPTAGFMDIQVCRYILLHVGDQFCYLWRQEAEALKLHENLQNTTIAWKKVVKGIREICDVCDTTLFNFHWTCDRCGFGVCLDCFKDRKAQRNTCRKTRANPQRGRDEFYWLMCNSNQKHDLNQLMLTQIIAGDALNVLGRLLHHLRSLWQVPQACGCLMSQQKLPTDAAINVLIQDMIKESQLKQQTSASSLATEETNRKQAKMEQLHSKCLEFARSQGIDYVPGRVWTKDTLGKDPITTAFDSYKHINFLRKGLAGLRRFLPPRTMNTRNASLHSSLPSVPHEWLCDGKLLRLTDAMHPDNRILFQEVWKCGQPVMISDVARSLNLDLWRPEAFCRDFGDKPNDLINCLNGNLVPNQPMRHFWEGFQCIKRRLLDANGKPMLLKLKDWPPGDDFAEILPTRFADLMKGLPMPEYTLRSGNLNITSCLPKMFVPPDLGPKMYNAYGSALHPDKGTTNLHLDISDAVNIMVYVGIPEDTDCKMHLTATQRAIEQGGCDYITRARSLSKKVLPGALWHIFPARDADKIRDLLNRVTLEKGFRLEPDHDPIHDQNWYLDDKLRARLFKEYGVEGYPIVQCLGDAVFIPAGAPHQVQNLHNCIKVAEDFVSPENITHCYHLTQEFRRLSHSHTNHEDKLQIKNIIYHAIKDCCNILMRELQHRIDEETKKNSSKRQQPKS